MRARGQKKCNRKRRRGETTNRQVGICEVVSETQEMAGKERAKRNETNETETGNKKQNKRGRRVERE